jgi:hypothetical protein
MPRARTGKQKPSTLGFKTKEPLQRNERKAARPTKIILHPSISPPHLVISTVSLTQTITTTTSIRTHARLLWDHRTFPLFTLAIPTTPTFTQSPTVCPAECVCDHPLSRQMNSENYITSIPIRPPSNVKPLRLLLGCMSFLTCQSYKSNSVFRRYQSITNWFQNQRSLAKKKREDEAESVPSDTLKADYPHETRHYSAFPPPSHHHSSLAFPPPSYNPSLSHGPVLRRSSSVSPSMEERSPRRSSSHRNTTPYGISATFSRPRRSRPEPYQLEALKQLYKQTSTPTIEERSALALEIGMYVNYFC